MKTLKKIFPIAFAFSGSGVKLALGIIIHIAAMLACPVLCLLSIALVLVTVGVLGFLFGFTMILAPLSVVIGIIGGAVNVCIVACAGIVVTYLLVSLIMNILAYAKVFGSDKPKVIEGTAEEVAEEKADQ